MADAANLGDAAVRRLTQQVVAPGANEPFGAYLFCGDDPGAALGRYVERTVFLEWSGTTPEMEAEAYDPYETSSAFICVIDHLRGIPVGAMRVVLPSSVGFKSLNDIKAIWGESAEELMGRTGLKVDLSRTWDIATLAVIPDYRGKATRGLVLMGLYQTLTLAARDCGIEWFVAIFDMPVFRMIRWKLHLILSLIHI